jgi:hypothetical protein
MNRFFCEREKEIVEVMRSGTVDIELERHAKSCPVCADAVAISEFLQAGATAEPVLPDSDFIWWKGQLAAKQMAVERATRSIVLVTKIAVLSISSAMIWLVFAPDHLETIASALLKYEVGLTDYLREGTLLAAAGALVSILLGSLYMVRFEK